MIMNFKIPFWLPIIIVCVILGAFLGCIVSLVLNLDPSAGTGYGCAAGFVLGGGYIAWKLAAGN